MCVRCRFAPEWGSPAAIVTHLKLDYDVIYMGKGAGAGLVRERLSAGQPTLFLLWTPHALLKQFRLSRIALPSFQTSKLMLAGQTDYATEILEKVASTKLAAVAPSVKQLYSSFTITNSEQGAMMASMHSGLSAMHAACHWMKQPDNENTWRAWIPAAAERIHFALLMPWGSVHAMDHHGGHRIAGAAALAVRDVNNDEELLPGRRLEYSWADSGCSPQQALNAMGELLGGSSRIDAVIGPGCSSACEVTS